MGLLTGRHSVEQQSQHVQNARIKTKVEVDPKFDFAKIKTEPDAVLQGVLVNSKMVFTEVRNYLNSAKEMMENKDPFDFGYVDRNVKTLILASLIQREKIDGRNS